MTKAATRAKWVLLTAVSVLTSRGVVRRARALGPVAPDLRSPILFMPLAPASQLHLKVSRRMMTRPMPMPVAEGVEIDERWATVDGREPVRVLTYEHPSRKQPSSALLWIHGGGTVIGKPEQGNTICSRWAAELGLLVVSVDYRLAPEHPFPAGLEDCYTVMRWLHDHAEGLGVDAERIAIGGDSAGGLLAASLAQLARDRGGPHVAFQLLEYPMLDDRTVLLPDPGPARSFIWSPGASRFGWTAYLGGPPRADDDRPYIAPARMQDLSGLPAAWIGVGSIDLLHDEVLDYARRLRDAGVSCDLHIEPGMYHGADSVLRKAPTSVRFANTMTDALARGLSIGQTSQA